MRDVTISRVCCDESVTLFRTGSLLTGNDYGPSILMINFRFLLSDLGEIEGKICMHKFACTNVTPKKNKNKNNNKKRKTEPKP